MSNIKTTHTVAEAVRVEFSQESDEVFLVFKIVDEDFKKRIKDNWMEDIELKLLNRKLSIKE